MALFPQDVHLVLKSFPSFPTSLTPGYALQAFQSQPTRNDITLKNAHIPHLIEVDVVDRLDLHAAPIVIIIALTIYAGFQREHRVLITIRGRRVRGLVFAFALCLVLVLGRGLEPDQVLGVLILVDGEPLQLELWKVRQIVNDEAPGLTHNPDTGVVISQVDDVKCPQVDHEVDVLE